MNKAICSFCHCDKQATKLKNGIAHFVSLTMPLCNRKLLAVLLLSLFISTRGECDQCKFTQNDPSSCKVYGLVDGKLVAWHKASTDCLDLYPVGIASINPDSVGCGDPRNVNSFVNAIKFESIPNSVRGGLGVGEVGFFVQQNGVYSLKDEITVNGNTIDCEASESDCYNAMKEYFAVSPGLEEMNQVCDTINNKIAVDRELEQSALRNQLCTETKAGTDHPSACEPLASQVDEQVAANPSKDCSGFQFGTQNMTIPGCEGQDGASGMTSGVAMDFNLLHFAVVSLRALLMALML